jgi:death-on-curing protein
MKEPVWLSSRLVLAVHAHVVSGFGGVRGVRDMALLESALARPRNLWAYGPKASLHELTAAYAHGICQNHPFVDGNKRTAFLGAAVFLVINGLEDHADDAEVVVTMNALASGRLKETEFAAWLANSFKQS